MEVLEHGHQLLKLAMLNHCGRVRRLDTYGVPEYWPCAAGSTNTKTQGC